MRILVTGGAGYIGSFMVKSLIDSKKEVFVIDNLVRSHKEVISDKAKFIKADIRDSELLDHFFSDNKVDVVMHFAGLISVEESTRNPELYKSVNVDGSNNLFQSAAKSGVKNFIFSSTAAVYGNPDKVPIPEDHPKKPTSPYGETKLKTEEALISMRKNDPDISFACLRYFNASGGSLDGSMGESHDPETHIIPLAINAVKNNKEFKLFGTNYNTPDGTCLRDYIHVLDLVEAHNLALEKTIENKADYFFNVGTGNGISNKEVVEKVSEVSGKKLKIIEVERRSGDADVLVADPSRIKNQLNFNPKYSDLQTIIESAWKWHNK